MSKLRFNFNCNFKKEDGKNKQEGRYDSSIFTFDIKGTGEDAKVFIDRLQIFSLLANVADVKSLVIHPGTTTHSQLTKEELESQGISETTVRLSIGCEHIDDLLADLSQALGEDSSCQ